MITVKKDVSKKLHDYSVFILRYGLHARFLVIFGPRLQIYFGIHYEETRLDEDLNHKRVIVY
jgi:hypothetical protein